jgi:RNA polymerase sigma-70 factor (ECF subfamily)
VLRSAGDYQPTAKFTTWLYTIARNFCVDEARKHKLRQHKSTDQPVGHDSSLVWADIIPDKGLLPTDHYESMEITKKLEIALANINPDQREVFLLREKSELAFEEIAQILGVSVNTAKSRMRYALEALKKNLKKMGYSNPGSKGNV